MYNEQITYNINEKKLILYICIPINMSKTRTRIRIIQRKFGGTKKTRGQVNQDLKDCMEEKTTLEKNLKDINTVLFSLQSQILEQNNKISNLETKNNTLETKNNTLETNIKYLETNIDYLETNVDSLETKNKEQNIEIGNLQSNVIYENIFTTLQDINRYKKMEENALIKDNGSLYKFRNARNKINHFIDDNDPITEKENKIKFIMDKLLIIKKKKPKLVHDFNNRYNGIISKYINYLKSINIEYDETTYEQNKPEYEAWWNHLP
jgi:chromosome segregation ATPase